MSNKEITISIVIPCYNSGKFLPEAIQSVEVYQGKYTYEIIIVDDGSTDEDTLLLLEELLQKGYKIIHQENRGPASARNTGVRNSKSEFILFLDSDNKIRAEYIKEGVGALLLNPQVGVIYGNPAFFGEQTRTAFYVQDFNIESLLVYNYIDMCTVVRKAAWEDVGGLDEKRTLIGHEDWEFWINLYKAGWGFLHINMTLFDYRIRSQSLITQTSERTYIEKRIYIFKKHADLVIQLYSALFSDKNIYEHDSRRPFRNLLKSIRNKYLPK